jgi:hypothetical protein
VGFNWSVFFGLFQSILTTIRIRSNTTVELNDEMEMRRDEKLSQSVKRGLEPILLICVKTHKSDPCPEMELRGGGGSELGSPIFMPSSALP